jgi:glycine cleavage system H protein
VGGEIDLELDDARYSPEHIWVRITEDNQALVGLTEEALDEQEDIKKLKLASEGDEFAKDEPFGRLTTTRPSVLRLYAPVSGEVIEVNEEILDAPEMILEDPYEEGWLIRIEISSMSEFDDLMTREEYEEFLSDDITDIELEEDEELEDEDEDD